MKVVLRYLNNTSNKKIDNEGGYVLGATLIHFRVPMYSHSSPVIFRFFYEELVDLITVGFYPVGPSLKSVKNVNTFSWSIYSAAGVKISQ